jgi:hypothetical protein
MKGGAPRTIANRPHAVVPGARIAIALAMAGHAAAVAAADFKLSDDLDATISATITVGTGIRTENPSTANFGALAGNRVGRSGGLPSSNSGGPDLNFERGSAFSTVLKGIADFDIHGKSLGAFARLQAWYDYQLEKGNRPYGNFANGFRQGVPLSDNGFAAEAEFSNVHFTTVYLYGKFDFEAERSLDARLGRVLLNWGTAQFVTGGINVVNPTDFAAAQRPGALPQETRIPVGMLYASFSQGKQWGIDGFVQFEARHDVLNGCGTYLNVATYAPTGCLQANVLPAVPEATAFVNGQYVHRANDVEARDSGQFGVSLRYGVAQLGTEFRGYAMNYHSRSFALSGTNANINGGFGNIITRLTNPNGVKYALKYPEDIRLYGLSFDTRQGLATRVFGEVAYRPNQPLNLNFSDLGDAFVVRNPNSLLNRPASGKNALALPPGATIDGYDRFKVTTASIGVNQGLPGVLGAQRIIVAGELGWSHVSGLPDPNTLRYGRSDAYGVAAIPGVPCTDTYPGKTCALDGFITQNAWGYRVRVSATYNDIFFGASLTPYLGFAQDVNGYSYDLTFLEGRTAVRPGIRADWGKQYFAEFQYTRVRDATRYSMLVDRDYVALVAGANF